MYKMIIPLSFALTGFLYAQQVPANQGQSPANSAATNSGKTYNSQKRSVESPRARRSDDVADLLNATNEARNSVEAQNKQDALFHINHAIQKADQALSQNPSSKFVPLYDELDQYTVLGPLMNRRSQEPNAQNSQQYQNQTSTQNQNKTAETNPNDERTGGAANRYGEANRYQQNGQQTSNAPNSTTVREVQGQYTAVGLDVQMAKEHLNAAKQAVDEGQWNKADAALAAVQNGVVVTSVAADMPLLRARENMVLARDAANNGNYTEAHAALMSASRALQEYENGNRSHSSEAKTLQSQIDSYNQTIEQNHSDAVSKIDSWWDQVSSWSAPANQPNRG